MARHKQLMFPLLLVAALLLVSGAIVLGVHALTATPTTTDITSDANCRAHPGTHYNMIIKNATVSPEHLNARQCDSLTITNQDNEIRLMAFGPHERHVAYDGVTDKLLNQGQSLDINLVQVGDYRFHDHEHDEVQGTFTVTKQP